MSVLKKIQIAAAAKPGVADAAIIGAGTPECQKSVRLANAKTVFPCFIAAR
ncbi:MAG: hypothetical protein ACLGG2_05940 [Gammaproteobacteria bacterium]